jgi:hypothetical protein
MNESFLQEERRIAKDMVSIPGVFIGIKSKAKSLKEEMRKRGMGLKEKNSLKEFI